MLGNDVVVMKVLEVCYLCTWYIW